MLKPPFRWFTRVEFYLGNPQIDIRIANHLHNLCMYLEPEEFSEVGITSYNFSKREWNKAFCDWLRELSRKGIKIKVVGGPEIEAKKELDELVKEGVVIAKILESPTTFHVVYATKPKQLWIEEYHQKGLPQGVHYTSNPMKEAWNEYLKLFNIYWEEGRGIQ